MRYIFVQPQNFAKLKRPVPISLAKILKIGIFLLKKFHTKEKSNREELSIV